MSSVMNIACSGAVWSFDMGREWEALDRRLSTAMRTASETVVFLP
jgi:hypothetical protein